jgi:hypothetical protein
MVRDGKPRFSPLVGRETVDFAVPDFLANPQ